jgi:hypothetical protein
MQINLIYFSFLSNYEMEEYLALPAIRDYHFTSKRD